MQQWQSIHHSQSDLPRLFVKASFDQDGYDVRVTDLSRIWTERLSKDGILDQANRQNCSVDPSEDDEQLSVLLQKVQSALSQASQTSLSLSATKKGDLKFRLGAPLPAPLPEFEWEVNLHRSSDNYVEEELVSPLLRQARNLTQNLESLIAELQAKDKIISKITDRLETSGHDLSTVFPGVANVKLSRKKSQQEQLARHVKGLGRFDEAAWRAQVATGDAEAILGTKVVNAVLSSLPSTKGGFKRSEHDGDWWRAIPAGQYLDLDDVKDQQSDHMRDGTNASQDGIHGHGATELEQDDGFQKQATPPHLRHSTPSAHHEEDENMDEDTHQASTPQPQPQLQLGTTHQQSHGDDSTDDEDDLDGPSQTSRPPTKPAHASAEPEPEPPAQPPSPPPVPGPQPNDSSAHDDETEDEDDLDQPSQHPPKAMPTPQPTSQQHPQSRQVTAASPRKRPGTIGGRASIPPASKEPTPAHESIEDPEPAPKAKPKSKLGTLGGKKPLPPPTAASPPSSPQNSAPPQPTRRMGVIGGKRAATPSSNATPPAEPRRESPAARAPRQEKRRTPSPPQEEKANAKRDLLKKELEEKANKAPAKKKRKF